MHCVIFNEPREQRSEISILDNRQLSLTLFVKVVTVGLRCSNIVLTVKRFNVCVLDYLMLYFAINSPCFTDNALKRFIALYNRLRNKTLLYVRNTCIHRAHVRRSTGFFFCAL